MKGEYLFITFEGGEGSGKSTNILLLKEYIEKKYNKSIIVTKEPGACSFGSIIRKILLTPGNIIDSRAELFLFLADRAQHLSEIIRPSLERGEIVLCDRYFDSTIIYQSYINNVIPPEDVYNLNLYASGGLIPDLTLFFKVSPETGMTRSKKRNLETNNTETKNDQKELDFHKKILDSYIDWFQKCKIDYKRKIFYLDSEKPLTVVTNEMFKIIDNFIE